MDELSIDQEVIGGVRRISKSQLMGDAFPAAIGHTASNWILMRAGECERKSHVNFSLCTIAGWRSHSIIMAIQFHRTRAHALARRAPAANFFLRRGLEKSSRVAYFRERRRSSEWVRASAASSRPLILFTYVLPWGWQTAWIRKIPACKSNLGAAAASSLRLRASWTLYISCAPAPANFLSSGARTGAESVHFTPKPHHCRNFASPGNKQLPRYPLVYYS